MSKLRSRFVIEHGGAPLDVTLKPEGSQALLDAAAASSPVVYVLLESDSTAADAEPSVGRQASTGGVRRGWRRRWLPALAIQLDAYLGNRVQERGLLAELLSVDDVGEMSEVLDVWRVPTAQLELTLGLAYDAAASGATRELDAPPRRGDRVLVPAARLEHAGDGAPTTAAAAAGEGWVVGRVEAAANDDAWLVAVSPELECMSFGSSELRRAPTAAEKAEEAAQSAQSAQLRARAAEATEDAQKPRQRGRRDAGVSGPEEGADGDDEAEGEEFPTGAVSRIEYRAAQGWEEGEAQARAALAERDAARLAAPPEPEPRGIDDCILGAPVAVETINGQPMPVAATTGDAAVVSVETKTRRSRGYDLVRVGNLSERAGVADIAFFHHRGTLHQFWDEATYGRQRLARQCCGVLRDVCDGVFGYDAAKVTLFYEPGAASRFVRQKLLFNIAPIEERARTKGLADPRTDAFAYAYFFGLCVHKLAHFFDVVHGTRHDFFMDEYRANYTMQWAALLLARGFDPAAVEREFPRECWEVVN